MALDWSTKNNRSLQVTESVEKMRAKERFINSQHDGLREEYRQVGVKNRALLHRLCHLLG